MSLIFENVVDPHNVAACLRTADIFGIQDVHVIEKFSSRFTVKTNTQTNKNKHKNILRTNTKLAKYNNFKKCTSMVNSE